MTARVYMGIDDQETTSFRLPRPDLPVRCLTPAMVVTMIAVVTGLPNSWQPGLALNPAITLPTLWTRLVAVSRVRSPQ